MATICKMSKPKFDIQYWNYFRAIENDLENLSRFVEFSTDNWSTYSIEMARMFLTVSSEIDVILKMLCKLLNPNSKAERIDQYRKELIPEFPELPNENVIIPLFGIKVIPWHDWNENKTPEWWSNHNMVKHNRNVNFKKANLGNVINSVGALLVILVYYYKQLLTLREEENGFKDTTRLLSSSKEFIRLRKDYYYQSLIL